MSCSMLHHLSFGVSDIERATAFYDAVLSPLGYVRVWDILSAESATRQVGYGFPGGDDLFVVKLYAEARPPGPGFHLAFGAPSRQAVDEFYAAAIANGGVYNGSPGVRGGYGPNYYAAFVTDPDGYAIEAVFNAAAA
jgi:catechol 2,3-dioxygenase-like lactoylglutathione lyase family enzyme